MMATMAVTTMLDLEELTGHTFNTQSDLIWLECLSAVSRQNVYIKLCLQRKPLAQVKKEVNVCCSSVGII